MVRDIKATGSRRTSDSLGVTVGAAEERREAGGRRRWRDHDPTGLVAAELMPVNVDTLVGQPECEDQPPSLSERRGRVRRAAET